jgi:hypothetical protein
VFAADLLRHRYIRDHLYAYASPAMAARFQAFDERSLATIRATPGLRSLATDPDLAPYLYYWCRPVLAMWSKAHGFHMFTSEFAPPPCESIGYKPAIVDHKSDTTVQPLSCQGDTAGQRTLDNSADPTPFEPQLGPSAAMTALLHANVTSPPPKRKRVDGAPPLDTSEITGTSAAHPFALDFDELTPPMAMPPPRIAARLCCSPGQT